MAAAGHCSDGKRRRRGGEERGMGENAARAHLDGNGVDCEGGGELTATNSTTSSRGSGDGNGGDSAVLKAPELSIRSRGK